MKTLLLFTLVAVMLPATLAAAINAGDLIISEFRLRGAAGPNDEYVELYNTTDWPLTVLATDGSAGFALVASDGNSRMVIPNGTVIPAHGHYLGANNAASGYSIGAYPAGSGTTATPDATWTQDIPENSGLALFSSSTTFDMAHRLDAAGPTTVVSTVYREGAGFPSISTGFNLNAAFYRFHLLGTAAISDTSFSLSTDGEARDTDNNNDDFAWIDTNGTSLGAGQRLGAPGPKNLGSPIALWKAPSNIGQSQVDPSVAHSAAPNRVRDATSAPANNSTFGTLTFNRTFTNKGGQPLRRLRFRIIKLTTFPAPSGVADLRPITSVGDNVSTGTGTVAMLGSILEQPPTQFNGGGWNSTFSADSVKTATPLAPGASVNLRFSFGIQQKGAYRLALLAEGLPGVSHLWYVAGDTENAALSTEEYSSPPDIAVEQPAGTNLTDGVSAIDFGSVGIGGGAVSKTFTVKNTGGENLTGLSTSITGPGNSTFKVTSAASSPIPGGGFSFFTVQASAATLGLKSAVLHIVSNDADESPFDITLIATGATPSAPTAITSAATGVSFTSATLNGVVNPNGSSRTVLFDLGTTTSYGSSFAAVQSPVNGAASVNVSVSPLSLKPHTLYHYRVRATSPQGGAIGADKTFTTANHIPVGGPDMVTALPSAKVIFSPLANDSDGDSDPLSITSFTPPAATVGTVVKSGTDFVFTPSTTFFSGSFTYVAGDGFGGTTGPVTVTLVSGTCTLGADAVITSDTVSYDLNVMANAPFVVTGAPPWLAFTPVSPGDTQVHFFPAPNAGLASRTATLKIGGKPHVVTQNGVPAVPVLSTPPSIPLGAVSASYDLLIPTINGPVTYTATNLPPGLTLSNTTRHLTGVPTTPGTFHPSIVAKNIKGPSNTLAFDITVLALPSSLIGAYSATVEDTALTDQLGGLLTMNVTATGMVSGALKLGNGSHSFTGRLNTAVNPLSPDPDHAVLNTTVTSAGLPTGLLLTVNMNAASNLIQGTVTLQEGLPITASLTGSRHLWNAATNPASDFQGYFTAGLLPADTSPSIPQGGGFLTFTVTSAGVVTWSGQLADGTVLPPSTASLWAGGQIPIFMPLYSGKGSLNQHLTIIGGSKFLVSSLHWCKKLQPPTVRAYSAGFGPALLGAYGSPYIPPGPGQTLLNFSLPPGNAHMYFYYGGIESVAQYGALFQPFTVNAAQVPAFSTNPAVNPTLMKLTKLDLAKGTVTGTMTLSDPNPFNAALPKVARAVNFAGVLVPPYGEAFGYFLLPSISGPPANVTTSKLTSGAVFIAP